MEVTPSIPEMTLAGLPDDILRELFALLPGEDVFSLFRCRSRNMMRRICSVGLVTQLVVSSADMMCAPDFAYFARSLHSLKALTWAPDALYSNSFTVDQLAHFSGSSGLEKLTMSCYVTSHSMETCPTLADMFPNLKQFKWSDSNATGAANATLKLLSRLPSGLENLDLAIAPRPLSSVTALPKSVLKLRLIRPGSFSFASLESQIFLDSLCKEIAEKCPNLHTFALDPSGSSIRSGNPARLNAILQYFPKIQSLWFRDFNGFDNNADGHSNDLSRFTELKELHYVLRLGGGCPDLVFPSNLTSLILESDPESSSRVEVSSKALKRLPVGLTSLSLLNIQVEAPASEWYSYLPASILHLTANSTNVDLLQLPERLLTLEVKADVVPGGGLFGGGGGFQFPQAIQPQGGANPNPAGAHVFGGGVAGGGGGFGGAPVVGGGGFGGGGFGGGGFGAGGFGAGGFGAGGGFGGGGGFGAAQPAAQPGAGGGFGLGTPAAQLPAQNATQPTAVDAHFRLPKTLTKLHVKNAFLGPTQVNLLPTSLTDLDVALFGNWTDSDAVEVCSRLSNAQRITLSGQVKLMSAPKDGSLEFDLFEFAKKRLQAPDERTSKRRKTNIAYYMPPEPLVVLPASLTSVSFNSLEDLPRGVDKPMFGPDERFVTMSAGEIATHLPRLVNLTRLFINAPTSKLGVQISISRDIAPMVNLTSLVLNGGSFIAPFQFSELPRLIETLHINYLPLSPAGIAFKAAGGSGGGGGGGFGAGGGGPFTFGGAATSTPATSTSTSGSGFTFGGFGAAPAAPSSTTSGFTFGGFGAAPAAPSSTPSTSSTSTSSPFTFGGAAPSTPSTSTSGGPFTFGGFGASSSTTAAAAAPVNGGFSFGGGFGGGASGASTTTAPPANGGFSFGGASSAGFGAPATPSIVPNEAAAKEKLQHIINNDCGGHVIADLPPRVTDISFASSEFGFGAGSIDLWPEKLVCLRVRVNSWTDTEAMGLKLRLTRASEIELFGSVVFTGKLFQSASQGAISAATAAASSSTGGLVCPTELDHKSIPKFLEQILHPITLKLVSFPVGAPFLLPDHVTSLVLGQIVKKSPTEWGMFGLVSGGSGPRMDFSTLNSCDSIPTSWPRALATLSISSPYLALEHFEKLQLPATLTSLSLCVRPDSNYTNPFSFLPPGLLHYQFDQTVGEWSTCEPGSVASLPRKLVTLKVPPLYIFPGDIEGLPRTLKELEMLGGDAWTDVLLMDLLNHLSSGCGPVGSSKALGLTSSACEEETSMDVDEKLGEEKLEKLEDEKLEDEAVELPRITVASAGLTGGFLPYDEVGKLDWYRFFKLTNAALGKTVCVKKWKGDKRIMLPRGITYLDLTTTMGPDTPPVRGNGFGGFTKPPPSMLPNTKPILKSLHYSIVSPLPPCLVTLKLTFETRVELQFLCDLPATLTHLSVSASYGVASYGYGWTNMPRGLKQLKLFRSDNSGQSADGTADNALDFPPTLEELYTPDVEYLAPAYKNFPKTLTKLTIRGIADDTVLEAAAKLPHLQLKFGYSA